MPKRSSKKTTKKNPSEDINVLASSIVGQVTGQPVKKSADQIIDPELVQKAIEEGKDPLAVLLGQRGGLKGGKARKKALTAERRKEIAQKAAQARWRKKK